MSVSGSRLPALNLGSCGAMTLQGFVFGSAAEVLDGDASEEDDGTEIIAVPEAETYLAAIVLLAGIVIQYIRRRSKQNFFRLSLTSDPRLNRSATLYDSVCARCPVKHRGLF